MPDKILQEKAHSALLRINATLFNEIMKLVEKRINEDLKSSELNESEVKSRISHYFSQYKGESATIIKQKVSCAELKPFLDLNYKAVLNTGQYKQWDNHIRLNS